MFFAFRGGAGEPPRAKPLRGLSWLPLPQESANIPATPDHMSKFISFVITYYGIHKVKNIKQERFECHLYGQLIALLMSSMITFEARSALYENEEIEVSEMKCMKGLRESAEEFFRTSGSPIKINNLFHQYTEAIRRRCRKCRKKNCETPFQVLKNTRKEEEKLILLQI
ncbi:hypothetical protein [Alteribacter aurantiacus]|uniref:hypothetical protein n=1 Tax=Alteribacter aurantiacus TaxID=254410 RepID=UPI00047B039D|nr:hypothetical protein [Alteribacter aurantiacus]